MKRRARAGPPHRAARKRAAPATAPLDQSPAEPVEAVDAIDRPGIEAAEQFEPDRDPRKEQPDIERVDERRIGSVQSVPDDAQRDAIAGFIEPE